MAASLADSASAAAGASELSSLACLASAAQSAPRSTDVEIATAVVHEAMRVASEEVPALTPVPQPQSATPPPVADAPAAARWLELLLHDRDRLAVGTMSELRVINRLAACVGVHHPTQATARAIQAVLTRFLDPSKSDKACWQAHHASESNYRIWKARLRALPVALPAVLDDAAPRTELASASAPPSPPSSPPRARPPRSCVRSCVRSCGQLGMLLFQFLVVVGPFLPFSVGPFLPPQKYENG